jgi:hypothetical protein
VAESSSVWKRFWSHIGWLDSIDVLIYGGLGLGLLGYAIYGIGGALVASGHEAAFGGFAAVVALTAASLVRDLRRRQLTALSKVFAAAWTVCVGLVIVVELIESFS